MKSYKFEEIKHLLFSKNDGKLLTIPPDLIIMARQPGFPDVQVFDFCNFAESDGSDWVFHDDNSELYDVNDNTFVLFKQFDLKS